jgi:RimJ/RimL family protein N-acetyltransferase
LIGAGGFGTLGARVRPLAPLRDRLPMTAIVCETPRLALRALCDADAAFILRLVNDPEWLRFIGDRNVHDLRDARRYINDGPVAMRKRHGFALDVVERKEDGAAMGLCGLIKRETLDDVDIGFAFLPEFRRHGFAREACDAVLERAAREFALPRVAAITSPLNLRSMKLLHALGFEFIRLLKMAPDDRGTRFYLLSLRDTPG